MTIDQIKRQTCDLCDRIRRMEGPGMGHKMSDYRTQQQNRQMLEKSHIKKNLHVRDKSNENHSLHKLTQTSTNTHTHMHKRTREARTSMRGIHFQLI